MKKVFISALYLFLTISILNNAIAQTGNMNKPVPMDPNVTVGKLDNGMKYYIRVNKKPEKRAELRLVVNAGSILEDDDQDGLAHFLEHMLFNGTKHFPKDALVSYLQSTGMKFGADINAATGLDKTYYKLQLPTDDKEKFEKGFSVLVDWAAYATLSGEEIDKERGVILEEWRTRTDANKRVKDQLSEVNFYKSKYLIRDGIGDTSIIKHCPYDALRRFYKEWYRPDLMSIIVVGDFDKDYVEKMIKKMFGSIDKRSNPRKREYFDIPDHKETLAKVGFDKEYRYNVVNITKKRDNIEENSMAAYRQNLVRQMYDNMLNVRLQEIAQKPDAPFIQAGGGESRFLGLKRAYNMFGLSKNDMIEKTLETILMECYRVKQHGFTQSELDRKKNEIIALYENAYNERDKTPSKTFLNGYMNNFLYNEPSPGIEFDYKFISEALPGISLAEVNKLADEYMSDGNWVITVGMPDKEGVAKPKEKDLIAIFNKVKSMKLEPYQDKVADVPFFNKKVVPGKVVSTKKYDKIGVEEWTLSNGAKVVLKKTDFNNEQILFSAFSYGGTSLIPNKDYVSSDVAASIVTQGGLADFDINQLQKMLTGKLVNVSPYIDDLSEGMNGSSTPKDLETMLQMLNMYFTQPRKDPEVIKGWLDKVSTFIKNRSLDPKQVFNDSIAVTVAQHHFRERPATPELISEINPDVAFNIYKERFANAGDFTFFFVGNFDENSIKPMIEKYIGSLPGNNDVEKWKDVGIEYPKGRIDKKIKTGIMEKSTVRLIYTGDFDWSPENSHLINSLTDALDLKLREQVREEKGGTYGAYSFASLDHYPDGSYRIDISFDCATERVDELVKTALDQVASLRDKKISAEDLHKVKETQKRELESNLKLNSYWLNRLFASYYHKTNVEDIPNYEKYINNLSAEDIQKAAKKYFNEDDFMKIVLYPNNSDS